MCTGCRTDRHGIDIVRDVVFGDFWMWSCGGCGDVGPNVGLTKMKGYAYVARSFRLHLARCERPRVVVRARVDVPR